ncbi:glycosyltransferase family 2 protein [Agromyces humi]|uniref:glycosyltransferase family 2 protein n=1 Tax=Agromyces humi TaxID=1766800 RepID=UPI0013598EDB|nr:glycosyltransferase family 2 protein [Agromyces humi]
MNAPAVAAVVVSYGSDDELVPFLSSLRDASTEPIEVVVADNLPGEGDVAGIATAAGVRYLPLPANPGYGGAVNAAVRTLSPSVEWVLVSNPDVVFERGSLDALVGAARHDKRIGSIGPRILNSDQTVYPSAREVPTIRNGVGHALFGRVWPGNPWTRRYHAAAETSVPRNAGWLSGACLVVRRQAFEDIGGFDERYFMYFEDVDLGYRLARAGWSNRYEPTGTVIHTGGTSTARLSSAMVREHHRSAERFIRSRYSSRPALPIRAVLLTSLRVRSFVVGRQQERNGSRND